MKQLLMLHGAAGTQAQFDSLLPLLEGHAQLHTLNFEGHGSGTHPDRPFTIDHFAENVLAYLDAQGITTTHIFGYSLGGYVALHLARIQPERVASVFTLATKFAWTPEVAAREAGFLDADKILEKVPQYAATLEKQHGAGWRTMLAKTRDQLLSLGAAPLLNAESMATITQPVRLSVGDRDKLVSIEESLAMYRPLPNGTFQVFPNTPHPLDKAPIPILANALRDFV